ncbi:MAG: GNAT family N-acetyltransferase [Phycisphaerales bacterium JB040]
MEIRVDDPRRGPVAALLAEHLAEVSGVSPPESTHALSVEGLCARGVTFWSACEGGEVLGCAALSELDGGHAEVKSMRTALGHLRRGVASALLAHLLAEARARGYARVSLETGAQEHFAPARALYERFGFERCGAFGKYREDPNSVFMTMGL